MVVEDWLEERGYEGTCIFPKNAYNTAFVGVTNTCRAVYSYEKMIEWIIACEDCSYAEATRKVDDNVLTSCDFVADGPLILMDIVYEDER